MDIAEAIISRIIQDKSVSLTQLEQRAQDRAVSLSDLYAALDRVSRDKRIKRGVRGGEVYYEPAPAPKTPIDHLKWVREHYPDTTLTAYGQPIPFYDPEYDGPTPSYSKETDKFYREKNEALKRAVDSEKFQRPVVYDRKRYG